MQFVIFLVMDVKHIFKSGTYLSDGAWGTEFLKKGFTIGESADLLNETRPGWVREVAAGYAQAGADIILTNTFGANRIALSRFGLESKARELNRQGVLLSRQAAGPTAGVFASLGPTGRMISAGEITGEAAEEAFLEQAIALKEAGADAVVVETMGDLEEYSAAIRAVKTAGLPVAGCMSFDSGKDFLRTLMGVTIDQMVEAAEGLHADMVGANCGVGVENYVKIAETLLKKSRLPVWIKANAGLPRVEKGGTVYDMTPDRFAGYVKTLSGMGVRVIGGCCGTTPDFIRASRRALDAFLRGG